MSEKAFRGNKLATKETKAPTFDKPFKNFTKNFTKKVWKTKLLVFENFKSAFESFKKINWEALLGLLCYLGWMSQGPELTAFNHWLISQKTSASDVTGALDSPFELTKNLENTKCLRCLVIRLSGFLRVSCIAQLSRYFFLASY